MLPAPRTTATSTPESLTALTCRAIACTRSRSVPYSREPIRASPESLSRIRLNARPSGGAAGSSLTSLRAHREAGEALDDDVLAQLAGQLGADLLDGLALELVRIDVRLVEQGDFFEPLAQLALGDPAADLLGLVGGLLLEHPRLGVLGVGGDFVLGDPLDRR